MFYGKVISGLLAASLLATGGLVAAKDRPVRGEAKLAQMLD